MLLDNRRCVVVSVVSATTTLCAALSGRLAPLALSLKHYFVQGIGEDESSAASLSSSLLNATCCCVLFMPEDRVTASSPCNVRRYTKGARDKLSESCLKAVCAPPVADSFPTAMLSRQRTP